MLSNICHVIAIEYSKHMLSNICHVIAIKYAIYMLAGMLSVTEKSLVTASVTTLVTGLLLNFGFKFFFILFLYTVTKVTENKVKF